MLKVYMICKFHFLNVLIFFFFFTCSSRTDIIQSVQYGFDYGALKASSKKEDVEKVVAPVQLCLECWRRRRKG